jgi:hypothetical protein
MLLTYFKEEKLALEEGALEEEADAVKQLVATIVVSCSFLSIALTNTRTY